MIKKITITGIWRNTQDKNGNPLRTRAGKPYERVSLRCEEYKDVYVSGFGNEYNKDWKIGDSVKVKIEKRTIDGKEYLNFSRVDELELRVIDLEEKVKFLIEGKQAVKEAKVPTVALEDEPPMDEIPDDLLPF